MKKFLLTASMLMMGVVATFAQNWEVGQEITNEIGWGNLSFENSPMDFWKVEASGSPTTTGGAFEAYDNDKVDLYQYVKLPAGMYKVVCQGYYRGGSSGSDDPTAALGEGQCAYNWSNRDNWVDNAFLSVYNGVYNEDKGTFIPNHQFKTPLMPRLFEGQTTQVFDEGSEHPDGWNKSDYFYTDLGCYGPTSFPGSCAWFQAGKYMPYEDDDVKYNTVTFFLTEEGYVKVGVVKNTKINQDSFFATNFKMYYMGEAGEAAALLALQDDVEALYEQLVDLRDNGVGFLKGKLEDEIMLYEMAYSADAYSLDKEEATEAKAKLSELLIGATTAKGDLASLQGAISSIEALISTTDYPGKADLTTALEAAKSSISEDYIYEGEEDWDTYQVLRDALYAARLNYLKSSPKGEDGSWDFTAFINYHWFCNPEYEPSWDAETNSWVPNQAALDLGWSEKDDVNGTAADIASMVKLGTDQTVIGEWYRVNTGLEVYWNDNLPCVKKWDMPHTDDGVREVAQKIVGIPNGFYKLKALGQTWSNDWDQGEKLCKCRIYAKSGDMVSESPYLELGGWWGKDINQWKELETDFVEVKNNELIIAGHDNGFIAWTNFRLFYYGETPDFNALLKPTLDKATDAANALSFNGDKKTAQDILAKVPATIENNEAFLAAVEIINQANDYINKANAAVNNWKGIDNFSTLASKYDDASAEKSFINTALMETLNVGEEDTGTWYYTDAIANDNQYKAYVSYLDYRESLGDYIKDALVAPVVEEQNAYLTATFATVEKLDEFKLALGVPYNKAKFAAEGIDKATLTNPVEATFLLINPSFDEGPSKGWATENTGAATNNEYSYDDAGKRTNAELWNRDKFTFSQTVNGLPAGTYELRVRALYRNAGGPGNDGRKAYEAAESEEDYPDNNAVLFAKSSNNEWRKAVKSIYSLKATENSFTQCGTAWEVDEVDGTSYATTIHYMNGTIDEADQKEGVTYTGHDEGAYPLDARIATGEVDDESLEELVYYYPASMQGFYAACKKDPKAYANSLTFYLSEEGNVEIGIRKLAAIGNDWVIMDDWQLFYLGKEAPTAIDEVAEAAEGAVEYYSVNGVKFDAPQQGINIVKYADGTTKKVFIQ